MFKPKVLLVDDHPENLLTLRAVLASANYTLTDCTSGQEALSKTLQEKFDLILLDVQMPELNGFQTAKLLKTRPATISTTVIFLSSFSEDEHAVIEGYQCGGADFVTKPFHPETLKKKVEFFLSYAESIRSEQRRLDTESEYIKFLKVFNELIDPLGAVLLNVQMLKKFSSKESHGELQKLTSKLEFLEVSTRRLKNLIMGFRSGSILKNHKDSSIFNIN